LVPVTNAIVGIDVADAKQIVVVRDHDSKVLARRTFGAARGIRAQRWTGQLACRFHRGLIRAAWQEHEKCS
jgi:hypothetical protein